MTAVEYNNNRVIWIKIRHHPHKKADLTNFKVQWKMCTKTMFMPTAPHEDNMVLVLWESNILSPIFLHYGYTNTEASRLLDL